MIQRRPIHAHRHDIAHVAVHGRLTGPAVTIAANVIVRVREMITSRRAREMTALDARRAMVTL
jgi:hypothetical protein